MKTKTVYRSRGAVGLVVVSSWRVTRRLRPARRRSGSRMCRTPFVRVDVGAKGKSPGDMEIVRAASTTSA